jgi:16S rRNA (guanine527-N7)-methyltransferase
MQNELDRFESALRSNMPAYGVELDPETLAQLGTYYSLLTGWNDRLHLVAPCSPAEFATRHVLESLILLEHLPPEATIADVGSGAGLPIVPCLIVRPDLQATLIESSQKKTVFLREALAAVERKATIIARRFEDIETPPVEFVTCRALDRFIPKIPALIAWAPDDATLLLFGGKNLLIGERFLIPGSERRYLFVKRKKDG